MERTKLFMTFFMKTFFMMNFLIGSMAYIFGPDKASPVPEPFTMLLIGMLTGVLALMSILHRE